jgi:orotate phosphoribosyltransferase
MSSEEKLSLELSRALVNVGALRFGDFPLASGKRSPYYLDLRMVPSYPSVYRLVLRAYQFVLECIGVDKFDGIAGVATAGLTISSPLAVSLGIPMIYVRKDQKDHGLGRKVEGRMEPGWRFLVVDDVVTSGRSLAAAVSSIRNEGGTVTQAAVLVDRLQGAKENLGSKDVKLNSFLDIRELADILQGSQAISEEQRLALIGQSTNPNEPQRVE